MIKNSLARLTMMQNLSMSGAAHAPLNRYLHSFEDSSDRLLQISRRLDWRFLLPDPELGSVAYLGTENSQLFEALRLFSLSLTRVDKLTGPAEYDILVAHGQSAGDLTKAASLVRPGGYVYAEAYGLLAAAHPRMMRRAAGKMSSPNRLIRAMEKAGWVEVQAYWHWPDFETCTRIIPFGVRSVLEYAFRPAQTSRAARLQALFGRWLLERGLISAAAPCFSILGRRPYQVAGHTADDAIRSSR